MKEGIEASRHRGKAGGEEEGIEGESFLVISISLLVRIRGKRIRTGRRALRLVLVRCLFCVEDYVEKIWLWRLLNMTVC